MKIFALDPQEYRERYAEQGYVHIRDGMDPEFRDYVCAFAEKQLRATKLDRFAIQGKKEQSLFEFPDDVDYPNELFDSVATLCGLDRGRMTLSERHIQAYDPNADPDPVAHKDRYPSQVSVGFSVKIPQGSSLVLYPYDHREINPFNSAAALNRHLQGDAHPTVALKTAREVVLHDETGDIVMFPGSTTWHLRRNAANTINLYLKLNDFDCDPLGEDAATPGRREQTLSAIANGASETLDAQVAVHGRRLDYVGRQHARDERHESHHAAIYGEEPFGITEAQATLMRLVDGRRTIGSLVDEIGVNGVSRDDVRVQARALLERGALDIAG
jgi:hypothetical protein